MRRAVGRLCGGLCGGHAAGTGALWRLLGEHAAVLDGRLRIAARSGRAPHPRLRHARRGGGGAGRGRRARLGGGAVSAHAALRPPLRLPDQVVHPNNRAHPAGHVGYLRQAAAGLVGRRRRRARRPRRLHRQRVHGGPGHRAPRRRAWRVQGRHRRPLAGRRHRHEVAAVVARRRSRSAADARNLAAAEVAAGARGRSALRVHARHCEPQRRLGRLRLLPADAQSLAHVPKGAARAEEVRLRLPGVVRRAARRRLARPADAPRARRQRRRQRRRRRRSPTRTATCSSGRTPLPRTAFRTQKSGPTRWTRTTGCTTGTTTSSSGTCRRGWPTRRSKGEYSKSLPYKRTGLGPRTRPRESAPSTRATGSTASSKCGQSSPRAARASGPRFG
mmetsp:Transcript_31297/g.105351  ORF Transcript_31297/g.105351 Transcript_31297/m.105351 type:complete len:389 (+) Transcript_31297:87-1253(+)